MKNDYITLPCDTGKKKKEKKVKRALSQLRASRQKKEAKPRNIL